MSDSLPIKFVQACGSGKVEEFKKAFSSLSLKEKNEIIKFDHHACFHIAAANGQLDIVNLIINHVRCEDNAADSSSYIDSGEALLPLFLDRDGEGFKAAIVNQHFETVERIAEQEFLFAPCIAIIIKNLTLIKILWESPLRNCIVYSLAQSCYHNISSVQCILDNVPKSAHHLLLEDRPAQLISTDKLSIMNLSPFANACRSGKLDIMRLLWSLFSKAHQDKLISDQFEICYVSAGKNGHLKIIEQLIEWAEPAERKISLLSCQDFYIFDLAADRGYLKVIQFIWESMPSALREKALQASNYAAYRLATKSNHTDVVSFLEAHTNEETREKMKKAVNQGIVPPK
jgi:hypothetical protein